MRSKTAARLLVALGAVMIFAGTVAIVRATGVVPRAMLAIAGRLAGVELAAQSIRLSAGSADVHGLDVRSPLGEPIAKVERVQLGYDLRDALPGGRRLFGIKSVTVVRPRVTIVRHRDGSLNVPFPSFSSSGGAGPPVIADLRLENGSVSVLDETRVDPAARRLYVDGIDLNAHVNTPARSQFTASLTYREDGRGYPARGAGETDVAGGYTLMHVASAALPVARLLNFGLNSPSVHVRSGTLRGIDVRYFGLTDAAGTLHPRLAAGGQLGGMTVAAAQLSQPIRNVSGRIDAYENGLLSRDLRATLGDIPLAMQGGLFDLAHPVLRVALSGATDAASLRAVAPQAAHLPVSGPLAFHITIEGSAAQPVALLALRSPQIVYNGIPLDAIDALVAADAAQADVFALRAKYGEFAIGARGHVGFTRAPGALALVVRADGPASGLPYVSGAVPGMALHASVLAGGDEPARVATQGLVSGATGTQRLAGIFAVNARGVGTLGPFAIDGPAESLYARANLDRPADRLAAVVQTRSFTLRAVPAATLPGFETVSAVAVAGTLTSDVFVAQHGARIATAGNAYVADARAAGLRIDRAQARFNGESSGISIPEVSAAGPWGSVRGSAAVLAEGSGTVLQVRGAQLEAATARGPQRASVDATLAYRGGQLEIYAARAQAPGIDAVASGSFGSSGAVALTASAGASALRAAGLPIQSGTARAAATLAGSLAAPRARGTALGDRLKYAGYTADAASAFAFAGDRLALSDGFASAAPGYAGFAGRVNGLAPARFAPQYDLQLSARAVDLHELAMLGAPHIALQVEGSADADVRVRGSRDKPHGDGTLRADDGSYHGLGFSDLRAAIDASAQGGALRDGSVRIGTTVATFEGRTDGRRSADARLRSAHADLADFNDYFDDYPGLAGTGAVALAASVGSGRTQSSGDAGFSHVSFRRIRIDAARTHWSTVAQNIRLVLDAGGTSGTVHVAGTVLPADVTLTTARDLVGHSRLDLTASARDVDVPTWANAFNQQLPVTGRINGDATLHGYYPTAAVHANASLYDGSYGRVPINSLTASLSLAGEHGTLQSAQLIVPDFSATAAGTFGIRRFDRLQLRAHAVSPDLGVLAREVSGRDDDVAGSLDATALLGGTLAEPAVAGEVAVDRLRYDEFNIPRVQAQFSGGRHLATVSNGALSFEHGRILFSGSIPLRANEGETYSFTSAPVSFDFVADDVQLSNFTPLLPAKSTLGGRIDGHTTLRGNIARPSFGGSLMLADGTFRGPQETVPITNARGTLALEGTTMRLEDAQAYAGGGTVSASGTISVPNVRDLSSAEVALRAVADHTRFDLPKYFKGKVDADLTLVRTRGSPATFAGPIEIANARIPVSALYGAKPNASASRSPLDVALQLRAVVGDDVRVVSPSVDVAGKGTLGIGGTLAAPAIDGTIHSTGGTIDFYRHFRLQNATLAFEPANGLLPYVNANAQTRVTNPDTEIRLHVTGRSDQLNVALASEPPYDREQILGLLVGAQQFGAVAGIQSTGGGAFSPTATAQELALGQVNTVFTRSLLQPVSAQIGDALGLQSFELYNDFGSGFGLNAGKSIGEHVTVSAAQSFGFEPRSSISITGRLNDRTRVRLTFFQTPNQAYQTPATALQFPVQNTGNSTQLMEIPNYSTGNGFFLSAQRKF